MKKHLSTISLILALSSNAFAGLGATPGSSSSSSISSDSGSSSRSSAADKVLIVNDVQTGFTKGLLESDKEKLIQTISDKILEAKSQGRTIVFVQFTAGYNDPGPIEQRLLDLVQDYSQHIIVKKYETNDGSKDIHQALQAQNIQADQIEICGLNTAFCLRETVEGLQTLQDRVRNISILAESCNDTHGKEIHEMALRSLSHLPNVSIDHKNTQGGGSVIRTDFHPILKPFLSDGPLPKKSDLVWVDLLLDSDPEVSGQAYTMLAHKIFSHPNSVADSLFKPMLAVMNEASDPQVRSDATRILANPWYYGSPHQAEMKRVFIGWAKDPDAHIRNYAITNLFHNGSSEEKAIFTNALQDSDPWVRHNALFSFLRSAEKTDQHEQMLFSSFQDQSTDKDIRANIAIRMDRLESIALDTKVAALISAVEDSDPINDSSSRLHMESLRALSRLVTDPDQIRSILNVYKVKGLKASLVDELERAVTRLEESQTPESRTAVLASIKEKLSEFIYY